MKKIPLTQGKFAIVDDEDYEWLNQWKWCADRHKNTYYACRIIQQNKKRQKIYMHRLISAVKKGQDTDHINHHGLDNRRTNLRICSRQENLANSKKHKDAQTSAYKGVYQHKLNKFKKWRARISVKNQQINLGCFYTEIEAAQAYQKAAKMYHGEFACVA